MPFGRGISTMRLILEGSTHSPTKVNLGLFFAVKATRAVNPALTTGAVLYPANSLRPATCTFRLNHNALSMHLLPVKCDDSSPFEFGVLAHNKTPTVIRCCKADWQGALGT